MSETSSSATNHQPTNSQQVDDQQAREFARQLRSAPANQVLAEVLSVLLNAARVKLGRKDARLFIDSCAVLLEHVRPYADATLTKQVDDALNQLRLGQVQAEKAVAARSEPEPNDLATAPAPPASGGQAASTTAGTAQPSAPPRSPTSKLWIPGRDF